MSEQAKPDAAPGWYPDPDQPQTQRYWDGGDWTEQRAPLNDSAEAPSAGGGLTAQSKFAVGLLLAGLGAAIAIVGVFLPVADTESSIQIAKNSMIQHWEGGVVIGVAVAGFIAALWSTSRPLTLLTGAGLIAVAVIGGTNLPIEFRNEFSEVVAGDASPGAGIWTVGVGGGLMALAAFFGDWGAFSDWMTGGTGRQPGERRRRWDEIMSGEYQGEDESYTSSGSADEGSHDEAR